MIRPWIEKNESYPTLSTLEKWIWTVAFWVIAPVFVMMIIAVSRGIEVPTTTKLADVQGEVVELAVTRKAGGPGPYWLEIRLPRDETIRGKCVVELAKKSTVKANVERKMSFDVDFAKSSPSDRHTREDEVIRVYSLIEGNKNIDVLFQDGDRVRVRLVFSEPVSSGASLWLGFRCKMKDAGEEVSVEHPVEPI